MSGDARLLEAMCRRYITAGAPTAAGPEAELFLRGIKEPMMTRMRAALDAYLAEQEKPQAR